VGTILSEILGGTEVMPTIRALFDQATPGKAASGRSAAFGSDSVSGGRR
jgi:hypothetical protein